MSRHGRRLSLLVLSGAVSLSATSAYAVFPDTAEDTTYTSVGQLGFGTSVFNVGGVAVDPFWVLTAEHVNGNFFQLNGERYDVVENVVPTIVNGERPDLRLLRVDRAMSTFTRIEPRLPLFGNVDVVGFGQTRTEQPGGYSDGFGAGTRRSATNRIEGLEEISFSQSGTPFWTTMYYTLSAPTDPTRVDGEGGIADQDSGGGWFSDFGDGDRLVAISSAVSGPSQGVSAYSYGGFGYGTYLGDDRSLAFLNQYVPGAVVPEPATLAALGLGAAALLRLRRR